VILLISVILVGPCFVLGVLTLGQFAHGGGAICLEDSAITGEISLSYWMVWLPISGVECQWDAADGTVVSQIHASPIATLLLWGAVVAASVALVSLILQLIAVGRSRERRRNQPAAW
jgi:hypothetical protein